MALVLVVYFGQKLRLTVSRSHGAAENSFILLLVVKLLKLLKHIIRVDVTFLIYSVSFKHSLIVNALFKAR